jgi:hypothetical protein
MDISEANKYTFQVTPHHCTSGNAKHWYWCDGSGCGTNAFYEDGNGFCPEDRCKINTSRPYTHKTTFHRGNDGNLYRISVELTQEGRSFSFVSCTDYGYLTSFTDTLNKGMVITVSQWGNSYGTMSWLDGMTGCSGDCNLNGTSSTYSDIRIGGADYLEEDFE